MESVTCKRVTLSSPISSRLIFARPTTSCPIAMKPMATALRAMAPIDCAPRPARELQWVRRLPIFPRFRLISSRYLRAGYFNVAAVRLSATSPFSRNMDSPVSLRRLSEYFRFVLRRSEPDRRPWAVKIEHNLRRARLADKQSDRTDFVEPQSSRHGPDLHRGLFYLGTTSHSCQSGPCDNAI